MKKNKITAIALVGLMLVSCVTSRRPSSLPSRPKNFEPHLVRGEKPKVCAAIRGNGELVMAHFGALAALSERFGPLDGLAGGSSASISSFLYESILANPVVWDCPDCTPEQIGRRIAVLLKSIWEYIDVLQNTEEARSLLGLQRILSTAQEKSIGELLKSNTPEKIMSAVTQMDGILESPELGDLVNPELADMLSPLKVAFRTYDAKQAFEAIRTVGKFEAGDRRFLFRPGVLNFPLLAAKIGRIGNFYAGYGSFYPREWMKAYLERCAKVAYGFTWHELRSNHPECVKDFHDHIEEYRKKLIADEGDVYSRVQDPVGMSAHVLVSTAILNGPSVEKFDNALQRYRDDNDFDNVDFNVFRDLRIGYWGHPRDLARMDLALRQRSDPKSKRAITLDDGPWSTAMSYSPAEPGLARLRRIGRSQMISAAGWPDLSPTLALRALGCEKVYYVTRRGDEPKFARGVARTLGMTSDEEKDLYDLDYRKSAASQSLAAADGVLCTNWDAFEVWQSELLERDAYRAPLLNPRETNIRGCAVPPKRNRKR